MALRQDDIANFETLRRACAAGRLALVASTDAATGEYRAVICVVDFDGKEYNVAPLGHLCTGDPLEQYTDPANGLDIQPAPDWPAA